MNIKVLLIGTLSCLVLTNVHAINLPATAPAKEKPYGGQSFVSPPDEEEQDDAPVKPLAPARKKSTDDLTSNHLEKTINLTYQDGMLAEMATVRGNGAMYMAMPNMNIKLYQPQ